MMHSAVMTITPEQAAVWLERNPNNRNVMGSTVTRYAKDMAAGLWELSPQGISFYEGGDLADGQHRLLAIIKAGMPVQMMVTFDVPRNNVVFDRGRIRSQANVLKLAGLPASVANTGAVGLINFLSLMAANRGNKTEDTTVVRFARDFTPQLAFCVACSSRGHSGEVGRKASVASAVFCAMLYGVPMETLDNFMRCVNSGFIDNATESAAIVVRNLLLSDISKSQNIPDRRRVFFATLNGIEDYAAKNPRKMQYKGSKSKYWDYVSTTVLPKYWEV